MVLKTEPLALPSRAYQFRLRSRSGFCFRGKTRLAPDPHHTPGSLLVCSHCSVTKCATNQSHTGAQDAGSRPNG